MAISGIIRGCAGAAWAAIGTVGTVLTAPVRVVSAVALATLGGIAKPVVCGATLGIAAYVAMYPEESREFIKSLLVTREEEAPNHFSVACSVVSREISLLYDAPLKYIGDWVLDPPTLLEDLIGRDPTFTEVATGVANRVYQVASPAVREAIATAGEWVKNRFGALIVCVAEPPSYTNYQK